MAQLSFLWPTATFLAIYTGLLFGAFNWMLKSQIKPVKELLDNHITDTNKKIDDFRSDLGSRIDRLDSRMDRIEAKIDRLIEKQS